MRNATLTAALCAAALAGCGGPDDPTESPDGGCTGDDCGGDDDAAPTGPEVGNDVDLSEYPPVVVRTVPESGAVGVDPALDRIEITFSRPMSDAWSWVYWEGYAFPELGEVGFASPTLHEATGVVLEPDTAYLSWLNSPSGAYESFTDRTGNPAVAYPLVFTTGASPEALAGFPTAVVAVDPPPGAEDVDPALDAITVTFARDMDPERFGWELDDPDTFPTTLGERFDGPRTAVLEVALEPGTTYAIWINRRIAGFVTADGIPAAPYLVSFRTADPDR